MRGPGGPPRRSAVDTTRVTRREANLGRVFRAVGAMASAAAGEPRREAPREPAWLDDYEPRVPSVSVDPDDAFPGAFSALGETQIAADVADTSAYEATRAPQTESSAPTDVVTHDWDDILARLARASDRLDAAVGLGLPLVDQHSPSPIAPSLALALAPDPDPARSSPSTLRAVVVAPAVASTASPRGGERSGVAGSAPSHPPRLSDAASEVRALMMTSLEPGRSREHLRGDREAVRARVDDFYLELERGLDENESRERERDVRGSPGESFRVRTADDEVRSASIPVEMEDESSRRYARIRSLRKLLETS